MEFPSEQELSIPARSVLCSTFRRPMRHPADRDDAGTEGQALFKVCTLELCGRYMGIFCQRLKSAANFTSIHLKVYGVVQTLLCVYGVMVILQ